MTSSPNTPLEDGRIERFEAFARSKPAAERYNGIDSSACALAQFGIPHARLADVGQDVYYAAVFNGFCRDIPDGFYTFGALAERLAALRAKQEPGK